MDADQEVVAYLETLIDHYRECGLESCAQCAVMRGACEFVRNRIFNSGVFPTALPTQPVTHRLTFFAPKTQ